MAPRYFVSKLTLKIRIQDKNTNIRVKETFGVNNIVGLKLFFPRLRSYCFNWLDRPLLHEKTIQALLDGERGNVQIVGSNKTPRAVIF